MEASCFLLEKIPFQKGSKPILKELPTLKVCQFHSNRGWIKSVINMKNAFSDNYVINDTLLFHILCMRMRCGLANIVFRYDAQRGEKGPYATCEQRRCI